MTLPEEDSQRIQIEEIVRSYIAGNSNFQEQAGLTILRKGAMQSPVFKTGVAGWMIDDQGNVEFNDGTFRGALAAATIDIGGSDATSFHVDISGNIWSGAATYAAAPFKVSNAGALTASGATVTGTIQTAASGQRIVISSATNTLTFDIAAVTGVIDIGTDTSRAITVTGNSTTTTGVYFTATVASNGFYYSSASNIAGYAFRVDITGATATTIGLSVNHDGSGGIGVDVDASGAATGVRIIQSGTGTGLSMTVSGDSARGIDLLYHGRTYGVYIEGDDASIATAILYATAAPSSASVPVVQFVRTNPGNSILSVKSDITTSNNHVGIEIDMNASTTTTPHAFSFVNDCFVSSAVTGTQDKKIRVFVGGATYYIPAYDA